MRLKLGSAFGIPIFVHWTFLLLPLWILFNQSADGHGDQLAMVLAMVPLVFGCVVLHEFGHALTARYFGIQTHDVTLYPIGGVARLERMTEKPLEEFLIAVAGPAVNVVIAGLLLCALGIVAAVDFQLVLDANAGNAPFGMTLLVSLLLINVFMVPFNMLPAFPMDGGRVLRAFLSAWLGHFQGTQIAVAVGVGMAGLMGLAGLFLPGFGMLVVIAVFIFFAGQQELLAARMRERQSRFDDEEPLEVVPVRTLLPREPAVVAAPPVLMLQPKISVYTWDNQTGTWRQDPGGRS